MDTPDPTPLGDEGRMPHRHRRTEGERRFGHRGFGPNQHHGFGHGHPGFGGRPDGAPASV